MKRTNVQLPNGTLLTVEGGEVDEQFLSGLIAEKLQPTNNVPTQQPRLTKQSTGTQVTAEEQPLALPQMNFEKKPAPKAPSGPVADEAPLAVPQWV